VATKKEPQCFSLVDKKAVPLLEPHWPAPLNVKACVSTRMGGKSVFPFDSMNLALHVEDDPATVELNREILANAIGQKLTDFQWLEQVHGTKIVAAKHAQNAERADGVWTSAPGLVCAVMTADCLPVLLCNAKGTKVMAVHAGWRGLAADIAAKAAQMFDSSEEVLAWMGPAIGPQHFEVGAEVREAFLAMNATYDQAFFAATTSASSKKKYFADIYQLCRTQLALVGVAGTQVYGGEACTYSDQTNFYSYRRDGKRSGRMASLIWLAP